jgi:hypothetical protein
LQAKRFFVIGDPIAHSLSPVMHGAALRALGLPHSYEAMRVTGGELEGVLDRVRRGSIHGLNVTVPHKVAVLALLDVTTDECATTGAAKARPTRFGSTRRDASWARTRTSKDCAPISPRTESFRNTHSCSVLGAPRVQP